MKLFSNEQLVKITNYIKNKDYKYEIEARFHLFTNYFLAEEELYYKLLNNYNNKWIVSNYTVDIMSQIRRITTDITNYQWQRKYSLDNINNNDYMVRLSISREEIIQAMDNFIPTITRKMERYSYNYNDYTRLDISKVFTPHDNQIHYEFEAELLDINKLQEFLLELPKILQIIQDTIYIYPKNVYNHIFMEVNRSLKYESNTYLNPEILYKPRDLKYNDLIAQAFLNGKIRVGFKTDGYRKLMLVDSKGIWLLYRNNLSHIIKFTKEENILITVLDGELVPFNKRSEYGPTTQIFYVAYDVLISNGRDVQQLTHKERLQSINNTYIFNNKFENVTIQLKNFYDFNTSSDFFNLMDNLENIIKPNLPYREDGYIFISNNMSYNSKVDHCSPKERILSKKPDMCKWKPINKLSIDFKIEIISTIASNDSIFVHFTVLDKTVKKNIIFPPTIPTLLDKAILIENNVFPIKNGAIYECIFNKTLNKFIPIKQRYDRPYPNALLEAYSVWEAIQDPISIDVFLGKGIKLLRKYHNRIKRELYSKSKAKYLLDIGVGQGGTIDSWKNFDKVVAIEPNLNNLSELLIRLNNNNIAWHLVDNKDSLNEILLKMDNIKVLILITGGEDYDFISKAVFIHCNSKVDVVAAMFSLTFFWKSNEILNGLLKTIDNTLKIGGQLIFMVMDGFTVRNIFEPQVAGRLEINNIIKTDNYKIEYNGYLKGEELKILINDTIVIGETVEDDQIEYLCYIHEIIKYFNKNIINRLDKEPFLNKNSKFLSGLYIYGVCNDYIGINNIDNISTTKPEPILEKRILNIEEEDKLQDLSENFLKSVNPQPLTYQKISVTKEDIISHIVNPLIKENNEDDISKENHPILNDYIRIAAKNRGHSAFYDAFLKSFYPDYSTNTYEHRDNLIFKMIKTYSSPILPILTSVFNLNIIIIGINTLSNLVLLEQSIINIKRPYIILAKLKYKNTFYYEVLGKTKLYRNREVIITTFTNNDDFIISIYKLPRHLIKNYYTKQIISNRSSVILKSELGIIYQDTLIENYLTNELHKIKSNYKLIDKSKRTHIINSIFDYSSINISDHIQEIIENEILIYNNVLQIVYTKLDIEFDNSIVIDDLSNIYNMKYTVEYDLILAIINYRKDYGILADELYLILKNIKQNGACIILIYELNVDYIISLLYYLKEIFGEVRLVKPYTTPPYLSYSYIYANGFILNKYKQTMIEFLLKTRNKYKNNKGIITLVSKKLINEDKLFINNIKYILDSINGSEMQALKILESKI